MRLGLLSDVHGNAPALTACLGALSGKVDFLLFMGDIAGYYPFVHECLEMLGDEVLAVRGNHDAILLESFMTERRSPAGYRERFGSAIDRALPGLTPSDAARIEGWPTKRSERVGSRVVMQAHGAPWDPLEGRVYPTFADWDRFHDYEADVIALGHTHYPLVRRVRDTLIVNPGSVGQPRDRSGAAAYAVLDLETMEVEFVREPYDAAPIIADAREHDPDVPYLVDVMTR